MDYIDSYDLAIYTFNILQKRKRKFKRNEPKAIEQSIGKTKMNNWEKIKDKQIIYTMPPIDERNAHFNSIVQIRLRVGINWFALPGVRVPIVGQLTS